QILPEPADLIHRLAVGEAPPTAIRIARCKQRSVRHFLRPVEQRVGYPLGVGRQRLLLFDIERSVCLAPGHDIDRPALHRTEGGRKPGPRLQRSFVHSSLPRPARYPPPQTLLDAPSKIVQLLITA